MPPAAASLRRNSRGDHMHFERILPVVSGDPLRYTGETCDPLFDNADEPELPRTPRRRKVKLASTALLLSTLACGGPNRPAIHATDAILVQLEPGAAPPARLGPDASGPPIVALSAVASSDEAPLLRVPLEPGDDPDRVAESAAQQPGVAFAEPIYMYYPSKAPDDPRYKDLWGMAKIDAPGAWTRTTGERAVTVAVVDDGVLIDHADLKANIWTNQQELDGNGLDDDQDGFVDDVHGWDFVN